MPPTRPPRPGPLPRLLTLGTVLATAPVRDAAVKKQHDADACNAASRNPVA
ncbi:hypothetical protein AB0K51_34225 [Kitasatospora sp. NPDC049285]|uniref:hypothetical protein n=1 Tax=Kitasatospora sp. NPDC049285 TaxID=3157096 RepID=UPI00343738DB